MTRKSGVVSLKIYCEECNQEFEVPVEECEFNGWSEEKYYGPNQGWHGAVTVDYDCPGCDSAEEHTFKEW